MLNEPSRSMRTILLTVSWSETALQRTKRPSVAADGYEVNCEAQDGNSEMLTMISVKCTATTRVRHNVSSETRRQKSVVSEAAVYGCESFRCHRDRKITSHLTPQALIVLTSYLV